jgi:hypothetical protein
MTLGRYGVLIALVFVLDVRAVEAQCTYSVSPLSVTAPSTGMNGSISVVTGSACAWTPVSQVPWITITSGGMSGLGSFSYSVASTGTARTGTMTVGGQTITVSQGTGSCSYSAAPLSVSAPSTGFNGSISVITGSSCAWTPVSSVPWITVTSGGMSGLGSFTFSVAVNGTGAVRTGTLTVGGEVVTVTQSTGSCTYSVSPANVSAPLTGLNGTLSIVTGSSCAWAATSSVAWITITTGGMSGIGSVNFTVSASATGRTGTITVGGQTVTVTQGSGSGQPPAAPTNLRIVIVG